MGRGARLPPFRCLKGTGRSRAGNALANKIRSNGTRAGGDPVRLSAATVRAGPQFRSEHDHASGGSQRLDERVSLWQCSEFQSDWRKREQSWKRGSYGNNDLVAEAECGKRQPIRLLCEFVSRVDRRRRRQHSFGGFSDFRQRGATYSAHQYGSFRRGQCGADGVKH